MSELAQKSGKLRKTLLRQAHGTDDPAVARDEDLAAENEDLREQLEKTVIERDEAFTKLEAIRSLIGH